MGLSRVVVPKWQGGGSGGSVWSNVSFIEIIECESDLDAINLWLMSNITLRTMQ